MSSHIAPHFKDRFAIWASLSVFSALVFVQPCAGAAEPAAGKMTVAELEQKARRLQAIVEEKTLQAHGLIPMFVRCEDYRLPTADDYKGAYKHRHLRGKSEADIGIPPMHVWRAWENSAADTAGYLGGMSYRYRCTQEPKALAICARTLRAIQYIHHLAVEKGERGFLCKPYGGEYSNQTSGDQMQCVLAGLAAYRPIAPPQDREIIDRLTRDFADHQIEVDYDALHGYFAYPRGTWNWSHKDWGDGLIHAPLLHLAWNSTGDPKYLHEIRRWYDHCGLDKKQSVPSGKTIRGHVGYRTMYLSALMMEFDPHNHELWRSFMLNVFRTCKTGICPDGSTWHSWEYDSETGKVTPLDPGWGGGPTRTGRSAALAMACVEAQRWFPDEDMAAVARIILEGLDEDTFRFVMPASADQKLAPEWRVEGRMLDHDGLIGWLWAYWEGRWRGYW